MIHGVPASAGVAVAKRFYWKDADLSVSATPGRDPVVERARFADAAAQTRAVLVTLQEQAARTDKDVAQVFEIHRMMLEDPDFREGVEETLKQGYSAEFAVKQTADGLTALFRGMEGDEYMQARAADVQDVASRLIRILKGVCEEDMSFDVPVIVVAEDLLPSQILRLDKSKVAGFVTKLGSTTSHAAILARTLGIPCVVGVGAAFDPLPLAGSLAMDGSTGEVVPDPDEATQADFEARRAAFQADVAALESYQHREAVTRDGHKVMVTANIGGLQDIDAVLSQGADGVGLFRSEFIYLDSSDFPTEEAQFAIYKKALERLRPRPVIVRTLDIGSDKQAPYFGIEGEANPALGYRAIRICLKEPSIFRTQLRALLRVSVYGNLHIMFPMITQVEQVRQIKAVLAQVQVELEGEGVLFRRDVPCGIMVETPAAALMSDELAREVDFFSIGTNDLTQYTLAADRTNDRVRDLFDPADPAVLRLIEMTAKNAHAAGIWVGICGESAADTALTPFYLSVGIDELSVSASAVPRVKRAVIEN